MKKKIYLTTFFSLIVLLLGGLFASNLFLGVKDVNAEAAPATSQVELTNSKTFLLVDGAPYGFDSKKVSASETTGYGKFQLNEENVEITTLAKTGFVLVGWNVTYYSNLTGSETAVTKFFNNETKQAYFQTEIEGETFNSQPVTLTFSYRDVNTDGYLDTGRLTISNVFSNMIIDPVFDYIYYNVDVSSVFNLITARNYSTQTILDDATLYYESLQGDVYKDSYVKTENGIFYFGDVLLKEGKYYTTKLTDDVSQNVEIERGAFRFADTISLNLDIDQKPIGQENSVNIDVLSANLTEDGSVRPIEDIEITKEINSIDNSKFDRTENVALNFVVADTNNKLSKLSFEYHNLYLASFEIKLDEGENLATDENYVENSKKLILQNILVENAYSQLSDYSFWVKSSANNANNAIFKIFCNQTIFGEENISYVYYNFDSMSFAEGSVIDGSSQPINNNLLQYANIAGDFVVEIKYSSALYEISFQPYVLVDNSLTLIESEDFVTHEKATGLVRGETRVFGNDAAATPQNTGYIFYGYAFDKANISNQKVLNVTIDENKPQSYTIIMIYTYYNYSLQLANYDSIDLQNDGQTYFPISSLEVQVNGKGFASLTYGQLHPNTSKNKSYNFNGNLKIGDVVRLKAVATAGFTINGFYFANKDSLSGLELEFVVDKTFIETNVSTNIFVLNVEEIYTLYTVEYFIEKTTILDAKIAMAELETNWEQNVSNEDLDDQYKITITNLKYFDKLNLTAKAKGEYNFVRFTSSRTNFKGELPFTNDSGEPVTYTYSLTVFGDEQIKVVYSTKEFNMQISVNYENAFNGQNLGEYIEILQDGEKLTINNDNTVQIKTGQFTIRFIAGKNPNFGFRFNSYSYKDGLSSTSYSALELPYPYEVSITPESEKDIKVKLIFDVIQYQVYVYQYGNVFVNGQYKTLNNQPLFVDGHSLNLNFNGNDLLEFNLIEGSYIKNFYFVKNNIRNSISSFVQNNDSTETTFSQRFSESDAQTYCTLYGEQVGNSAVVNLKIDLEYELHYYTVEVDYLLTSSKGPYYDALISYPILQLEYTFKGTSYNRSNSVNEQVVKFDSIPYGVSAKISLKQSLPKGYSSSETWERSNLVSELAFYDPDSITISKLVANERLIYAVDYTSYKIEVRAGGGFSQGKPQVEINGVADATRISNFETLSIYMNANKNYGFKFSKMYYFVDYIYNEETWPQDVKNLFVLDGSDLVNYTGEYNEQLRYIKRVEYAESDLYTDTFNADNYALLGDKFLFIVEYNYIKIKITNTSVENAAMHSGDLNILPEDYATYRMFKQENGAWVEIGENDLVDYRNTIRIDIQLKSTFIDEQEFLLSRGLKLAYINWVENYESLGDGSYQVVFNISDVMLFVDDQLGENYDGILALKYNYGVEQINVSVTTNVTATSFYYDDDDIFSIYSGPLKGFVGDPVFTSKSTTLNFDMQFLGSRDVTYQFNQRNSSAIETSQNFKIKTANFYRYIDEFNTERIMPSEYAKYGISTSISSTDALIIELRMVENLKIVLIVEPIIHFNNYNYLESNPSENYYVFDNFTYDCDANGNGNEQTLTIGVYEQGDVQNIESSSLVSIIPKYYSVEINDGREIELLTNPIDAGVYKVKLAFNTSEEKYEWLKGIEIEYNIYFIINKRLVNLDYKPDSIRELQRNPITFTYNKTDTYRFELLKEYLRIVDANSSSEIFVNTLQENFINSEFADGIISVITNKDGERTYHASDTNLDIYIYNLQLKGIGFGANFELGKDSLLLPSIIRIQRAELTISGLSVYDKVEDGTSKAEYYLANDWRILGRIKSDDVAILFDNLSFVFDGAEVGQHTVSMSADSNALIGESRNDYTINTKVFSACIYPYSVETYVAGFGTITIYNERGKTDHDMVDLIPMDAQLSVDVIYSDSAEYRNLYSSISGYLSNRIVFAVGYKIHFAVGAYSKQISPNLFMSLPKVERLNSALWIADEQVGKIKTSSSNGRIVLDLADISVGLEGLIFTQNRKFLTWWQISLIILLILLIIILLVIIYIHQRRKQKAKDELNEKI